MYRDSKQILDDLIILNSLEWNKALAEEYNTTVDQLDSDISYSYFNLDENIIHFNKNNFKKKMDTEIRDNLTRGTIPDDRGVRKLMLNSVKRTISEAVIPLGKSFTGVILCGIEFKNVIFENTCFDNCVFYNCSFLQCEMVELIFTTCKFIGCEIAESSLADTFFIKTALFSMNFISNDHSEQLHFIDSSLFNNQFISNELDNSILSSNLIQNCYFTGNSMKRTRFFNVILANTNFENNNLKDSSIKNSNLYNIVFKNNDMRNMMCISSDKTIITYEQMYEYVFEDIDYISKHKQENDEEDGLEESYE